MITQERTSQVKARIMNRLGPTMIVFFVVVGVLGALAILFDTRENTARIQTLTLDDLTRQYNDAYGRLTGEVRDLASAPVTQEFAIAAASPGISADDFRNAQLNFVREVENLLANGEGTYRAVRFVDASGTVWVNGSIGEDETPVVSDDIDLRVRDPQTDLILSRGMASDAGTVTIGALDVIEPQESIYLPVATLFAPVTRSSDFSGVIGVLEVEADMTTVFSTIRNAVALTPDMEVDIGQRYLLVNEANQVLTDSGTTLETHLAALAQPGETALVLSEATTRFLTRNDEAFALRFRQGSRSLIAADVVQPGQLAGTPWRLVVISDAFQVFGRALLRASVVLVLSVLAGPLLWYVADRHLTRVLRRMTVANENLQQLAAMTTGQIEHGEQRIKIPADIDSETNPDESSQMLRAVTELEQHLEKLNRDIEAQTGRYNRNLSVAAQIGRETATLEDVDELLNRSINLISGTFGLYHAQVFLVDEAGTNAVLVYSPGEVGQRLLDMRHKLPVGSRSVIGRVTETGEPVIVNDTGARRADNTHAFNPILKDTRAEMALPLQIGDEIIGALDLQSEQPGFFTSSDLQTYQLLADQIAIAVYKTRLLQQYDQRIEQIEMLNRQLTQMAWDELEREVGLERSFRYNLLEVETGDLERRTPYTTGEMLLMPIRIRGEAIGTIHASPPDGASFTANDHAILESVAERVALAVENARLFQETQNNLAETSTLYQTSRYLNEAEELESIIRAIILSAMPTAAGGQIALINEVDPSWIEFVATWSADNMTDRISADPVGAQFYMPDYDLLDSLSGSQVTLVPDTAHDSRLNDRLREWFLNLNGYALVFIPLTVRGVWRGSVVVEFAEPRKFTDREGRIYNNLVDQAGVSIDNRLLIKRTERALNLNERLYEASRLINQARDFNELLRAIVNTSDDDALDFVLATFDGEPDDTGYPTIVRLEARSRHGTITSPTVILPIQIGLSSPLRQREPFTLDDRTDRVLHRLADVVASREGIVYPMFSTSRLIALFVVTYPADAGVSTENRDVFRALTGQMSTVIQNRNLLRQTEYALSESRQLYQASRAIVAAQDLPGMFEAALSHIVTMEVPVSRITVVMAAPEPSYDPAFLQITVVWERTVGMQFAESNERFERQQVAFSRLPDVTRQSTDVQTAQRELSNFPALRDYITGNRSVSVAFEAFETRGQWLGMLIAESDHENVFDDQYVRFLQAISDQIAIALQNQMLFEQAQQEARQALALAEATQLANQVSGQLADNVETMFVRVAETAGYDRWLLMQLNESETRLLVISQQVPDDSPLIVDTSLDLSTADHPVANAFLYNRTLMVNDPQRHPNLKDRPDLAAIIGKHIATPIATDERVMGALLVGRGLDEPDLTERDNTLIDTLAAQVAVTIENKRLFVAAERERTTLRSILDTLPAGVLVLDAKTLRPVQSNAQIVEYMGMELPADVPFSAESYNLYRTGTSIHYPNEELPIMVCLEVGVPAFSDDVSVITASGHQTDMLLNAAPIRNAKGEITNIVAAFEDISNLRSLENTLQDNLRETISLYEATRSLSEANELEEVLDVVLFQLKMNDPEDAHVILVDGDEGMHEVVRDLVRPLEIDDLSASVLSEDRIILIDNVDDEPSITETDRAVLISQGILSIATVPLRATNRTAPLGWVVANYSRPNLFTPEDERFLSTLGDNAAVAIDNRYLFQSTQRALRETSSLYSATTTISRARDLIELSKVVRASVESLSPDIYAGYLMTDPSSPDNLEEMFNISMDAAPIDFRRMLPRYGLFREDSIIIDDLRAIEIPSAFEQALLEVGTVQAMASVSLRVKGMPDGRLFLAYHQPHLFTEGEKRYLNAIADSASVVVDNILLLDQIQSALEETSTLYQASRSMADATSPEQILDVVVEKLIGPHINQVFVALLTSSTWEGSGATVQIVASWQAEQSIDLQGISLSVEQFPAWSVISSQTVITIDDVQTDRHLGEMERMGIQSLDAQSLTIIPLKVTSRSIGSIWISSRDPHYHSEREQRVFQAFAEQASLSLEASFLLEQTERRARQLATSAEVSSIASSILDIAELLPQVVDLIKNEFGYDHVQVFLMDDDNEYAELRASTSEAGRQLLSVRHKLARGSQSVIGQVTEQGRPVIALDTSDARVVHRPNPYLPLTRSEMALPVIIKGQIVGALDVQSNQPNAFGDDDIAVLTLLASQISVAIDNARLFRQAESRADEMSFLFTITTAAASADGLEEALQNVVELLRGSLAETSSVGVYLIAEDVINIDDEQLMEIVALAGSEHPAEEVAHVIVGDENNLAGIVAQDLIPVIIDRIENEPRYIPLVEDSRSAVIVPLSTGGEFTGLIVMESERDRAYNQDTLTLLLALGSTLAAIVQNALLVEDITRKNDELLTLDRLKSDFLANMSHELRTPLNSIIGFSRVMLKGIDGPLTEMQEQDLSTIYSSGQHLLGLINDILDSAKLAAEKMDLQREYFDLNTVLEGVKSIGIGLLKEKPVDIFLKTTSNMPEAYGDEFRTRQVLLNIVSNAAKFTSQGSVTITAYTVEDIEKGTMLRVDVTDTGIGIDTKDLPILFEAFRQVDSSLTRTVEGTGLGLPIAKSLVELQGGEMVVASELGQGSTFSITIPTIPVSVDEQAIIERDGLDVIVTEAVQVNNGGEPDPETDTVETTNVVVQNNGSKQKIIGPPPGVFEQKRQILLIEDNPTMVDQYRRLLQREGFEVQVASHAVFVETMVSGLRPTVVIMDVDFADGAGWDILKNVKDRDDTFDIPVIISTMNPDSERAYRLGAHSYIQRPYTPEDLTQAVLEAEQESNIDRILIIDDKPESTRLIEQILEAHGRYRVFAAHTGPEGIALVARRRPDLIILDLRMPEMDGFAVLEELRSQPETASIPIVVVTGETTLSSDERDKLINLEIIYKTDLNQDNYQMFIDEVRSQIARYHGE